MQSRPLIPTLKSAILGFPRYAFSYITGLLTALIEDLNVTTFALTAVAVGWATHSVPIAVAAFFVVYSFARVVLVLAQSVASNR